MEKIKEKEKKTIVYDYLFKYLGGDAFKGKIITGASIQLAIKAYKNGKEVKFKEEPKSNNRFYYCDNFKVSFDTDKMYAVEKNIIVDNLYRIIYGWDKIDYEVVGFNLEYSEEFSYDLPVPLKGCIVQTPMVVSEEEFTTFLKEHMKDFNIRDNIDAQVLSISFI